MKGHITFPPELYGEIISHVTDFRDLISLTLTSRTLQYESESILWRRVNILSRHRNPTGRLSNLPRVARHIRFLRIYLNDYSLADLLHDVLQATINLKSLKISCTGRSEAGAGGKWHLGYLCQGATFKLHGLSSRLPITQSCERFFCSQTELVDLDYSCDPQFFYNAFTSPKALPALKNLMTEQTHLIEALLPGRNVTHLAWLSNCGLQPAGGPFLTVKVLYIPPEGSPPSHLSLIFPNLETLAVLQAQYDNIVDFVRGFSLLKVAKIVFPYGIDSYQSSAQLASLLFKLNPTLGTVEVSYWTGNDGLHKRWILKRGCSVEEPDPSAYAKVLPSDLSIHDWKTW